MMDSRRIAGDGPVDDLLVPANGSSTSSPNRASGDRHVFARARRSGRVLFDGLLPDGVTSATEADARPVVATGSGDVLAQHDPDSLTQGARS
jgi:hypothetical protein